VAIEFETKMPRIFGSKIEKEVTIWEKLQLGKQIVQFKEYFYNSEFKDDTVGETYSRGEEIDAS
jgi:hypothetical protein